MFFRVFDPLPLWVICGHRDGDPSRKLLTLCGQARSVVEALGFQMTFFHNWSNECEDKVVHYTFTAMSFDPEDLGSYPVRRWPKETIDLSISVDKGKEKEYGYLTITQKERVISML
jgi:hypothetical protein